jgi:hypothetical protein
MNILRGTGRWLLSLAVAMMLTAWIGLCVMQATVLNRTAVQGWLRDSGTYQNVLNTVVTLNDQEGTQSDSIATVDDFNKALAATFPPSYIQQQSENGLNAAYDWVEGKEKTINVTIPINEKQAEFKANAVKIIETKLAALPPCPTRVNPNPENPTCIPQGMSATDLAARLTPELTTEEGKFLDKPLTAKELGLQDAPAKAAWVPATYANIKWLVIALPVGILLAAAGFVLLSDDRLKGLRTVSRRIALNGLFLLIGGVVLWQVGGSFSISNLLNDTEMGTLINPLFQQIVPALGRTLTALGGAVTVVGGIAWGVGFYLSRRQQPTITRSDQAKDLPKPAEAPKPVAPKKDTKQPPTGPPRPPSVV